MRVSITLALVLILMPPGLARGEKNNPATSGLWQLNCPKGGKTCQMISYLRTDKRKIIAALSLRNVKNKQRVEKIVGMVQIPLGFHVPTGIHINIDKKIRFKAKLIDCHANGCRAIFTANPRVLSALATGKYAHITLRDSISRKQLSINFSLFGFERIWLSLLEASARI